MSPSRSHQWRASSWSSASTSRPSSTGVTAMRISWPSSTISATVWSFAHSATAAKIRSMCRYQVGSEVLVHHVRTLDHDEQLVLGHDAHHVHPAVLGPDEVHRLAGEELAVRRPRGDQPGVGRERGLEVA